MSTVTRPTSTRGAGGNGASREPWLTKRELASELRCSTRTIERLHVPALRVGGQNRYKLSEVESYLRRGTTTGQLLLFEVEEGTQA